MIMINFHYKSAIHRHQTRIGAEKRSEHGSGRPLNMRYSLINPKTPKPHDVQCDINVNEYISIVYSAINNEYRMFRIQFEPCSGLLSAPILV